VYDFIDSSILNLCAYYMYIIPLRPDFLSHNHANFRILFNYTFVWFSLRASRCLNLYKIFQGVWEFEYIARKPVGFSVFLMAPEKLYISQIYKQQFIALRRTYELVRQFEFAKIWTHDYVRIAMSDPALKNIA
jgi:hypothetical protein